MASYKIDIARSVQKTLAKLPKNDVQNIIQSIKGLIQNPYPEGCRKLRGENNVYRIRQGHYRIIYEVIGLELTILVLKVGHRKSIYR